MGRGDCQEQIGEDLLKKKGRESFGMTPLAKVVELSHGGLWDPHCRRNQRRWRQGGAHPSQVYEKAVVSQVLTLLLAVVLGSAVLLHQTQS